MAQSFAFYDEQAKRAAREAQETGLARVRERALRAEAAWRVLANQAQRALIERAKAEQLREEKREAEAGHMADGNRNGVPSV